MLPISSRAIQCEGKHFLQKPSSAFGDVVITASSKEKLDKMGCGSSRSVGVKGSYRDCSDVFFTDGVSSRGEPDGQEKHGNFCQSERKEAKYKKMNKTLTQSTYISSSSSSVTEDTTEQAVVKNAEGF